MNPCLNLVIAPLTKASAEHFAIWVIKSPLPGGYVHHDCIWSENLTQKWLAWQEMFLVNSQPHHPIVNSSAQTLPITKISHPTGETSYGNRLMQDLGISLWKWLFDNSIGRTLAQSQGIAIGQNEPLRLRVEIRDPNLIILPWEIMQPESGKQAISLNEQFLFSRTTTDVDPLNPQQYQDGLNILLVLGEDINSFTQGENVYPTTNNNQKKLELEKEATILAKVIKTGSISAPNLKKMPLRVPANVDTLLQPTATELINALERGIYNVFFYAGHGISGSNGGLLFLRSDATINGTELAQVLVRNRVTLALFNACWGAQPDQQNHQLIPRSSLTEVLIHHGVPAVLGMRDSIADQEALTFIESFTQALCDRMTIDQAVMIARQQLLTIYKFNQPAWTLPILYMHPDFDGQLLKPMNREITLLPMMPSSFNETSISIAYLRAVDNEQQTWEIHGGLMRVGRHQDNDLEIQERWVSQRHAEIICRDLSSGFNHQGKYYLRDFSRFGTFITTSGVWKKIHHQEIILQPGMQIKFGSTYGQALEFVIQNQEK